MDRHARPLPLLGGIATVTVVSLALWVALIGSRSGAGIDVARASEAVSDTEVARADLEDLAAPKAGVHTARTEVVIDSAEGDLDPALAVDPRATCCVEGLMLLPRTFPGSALATIHAWPVDVEDRTAPAEESIIARDKWRIEDLMPGTWVFVARAEIGDRIAWGRSRKLELVENVTPDLVRILLTEYQVSGQITDSRGMPLAGITVGYEWKGTEEFAGEMLEVMEMTEVSFLPPGNFRILAENASLLSDAEESFSGEVRIQFTQSLDQLQSLGALGYGGAGLELDVTPQVVDFRGSIDVPEPSLASLPEFVSLGAPTIELNASSGWEVNPWIGESVTTGPDGRFHIALEGPGRVTITAPQAGGKAPPGATRWLRESATVEVTLDAPAADVHLALLRAARISGRLLRSDGNAAERVNVFLRRIGAGSTEATTTRDDGTFQFEGCRPGEHLFYGRSGGGAGQDFSVHSRIIVHEGDDYILDEVLTPSSSVTGLVLDDDNAPVPGVTVTAYGLDNNNLSRTGKTDASGQFSIVGMYGCEYRFVVENRKLLYEKTAAVRGNGDRLDIGTIEVARLARD